MCGPGAGSRAERKKWLFVGIVVPVVKNAVGRIPEHRLIDEESSPFQNAFNERQPAGIRRAAKNRRCRKNRKKYKYQKNVFSCHWISLLKILRTKSTIPLAFIISSNLLRPWPHLIYHNKHRRASLNVCGSIGQEHPLLLTYSSGSIDSH